MKMTNSLSLPREYSPSSEVRKKKQHDLNRTETASVQGVPFGIGGPTAVTEAVGARVRGAWRRAALWGRTQCWDEVGGQ